MPVVTIHAKKSKEAFILVENVIHAPYLVNVKILIFSMNHFLKALCRKQKTLNGKKIVVNKKRITSNYKTLACRMAGITKTKILFLFNVLCLTKPHWGVPMLRERDPSGVITG